MRLLSQQKKMVTIVIDKNSEKKVSWMDDHEFRYYNKMYDVVSATDSGNQVVYTCYEDENETNVVSELVNHIKNVASPYSSRNTSLKDHWPTDKYFSLQLKISIQSVQATSCGRDILLLPPDIVYCIIPTQPPDCI